MENTYTYVKMIQIVLIFVIVGCASAQLGERIVGGQETNIRNHPWQLSLMLWSYHICGASIINTKWALTSAYCVYRHNKLALHLRAGSNFHDTGGTIHRLKNVVIHHFFQPATFDYDIALIEVENSFNFGNEEVSAIKLPKAGVTPSVGITAQVSGWGTSNKENEEIPRQLRVVDLPIISNGQCQEAYNPFEVKITFRMICAGYEKGGKGICFRDYGGPLVINNTLYGIASWSYCDDSKYPAVFTLIGILRSWIFEVSGV